VNSTKGGKITITIIASKTFFQIATNCKNQYDIQDIFFLHIKLYKVYCLSYFWKIPVTFPKFPVFANVLKLKGNKEEILESSNKDLWKTWDFGKNNFKPNCLWTGSDKSLSLQRTELKLSKGTHEVVDLGVGSQIQYRVRTVGLYLIVESDIGIAVLWDRKTTVRIVLEPQHSVRLVLKGKHIENLWWNRWTRHQSAFCVANSDWFGTVPLCSPYRFYVSIGSSVRPVWEL
jgi:hypothetical protein